MRGDHVLVILIFFAAHHVRGASLFQPKAFYARYNGFFLHLMCMEILVSKILNENQNVTMP